MDSTFMNQVAAGLGALGVSVVRFEFPYMAARRDQGSRRAPDRMPVLTATWTAVFQELSQGSACFLGGKSMGGRVASLIADEVGARGLVCLGYPFHPAGKPQQLRTAHLAELRTPTLIVQGTRDALGSREDVAGYTLSSAIALHWIEDGDHSLAPRKSSGHSSAQAMAEAVAAIAAFMRSATGTSRTGS